MASEPMDSRPSIAGVLLAGGLSRRMGGGDKCLRGLAGRRVLDHVIARARPQVGPLVINANGDPARFAGFQLPIVADIVPDFAGPLAGVCTGMAWVRRAYPGCEWLASFATDTPFLPLDLVARLFVAIASDGAEMACASSSGRVHPVFGLWPVRLAGELHRALTLEGVRKVDAWTARYRLAVVDFSFNAVDPFFNANTQDDLEEAERLIVRLGLKPPD
jgi:molybdopterin-guanine dinucleotide biosynthesis protein A